MPHYPHETIHKVKDLPIHFNTYEEQGMFIPNHWHNSLEIVYIDHGHMEAQVNGMKYHLYDHQFILINSGDIHSTVCIECSRVFLLQIPRPFLLSAIPDYDHIRFEMTKLTDSVRERLKAIMVEMEKAFSTEMDGYTLYFKSLLYEMLFHLTGTCRTDISSARRTQSDKNRRLLLPVIQYVQEHYREPIPLQQIAEVAGLNAEYFCRFFKRNMGLTFQQYVNQIRLSHVYEDLLKTDYSIQEILDMHGVNNYKLFSRNFKEKYGMTPSQKRRQLKSLTLS